MVLLLKTGLLLTKSGLKPSGKSVLIPLGLTAAASAADERFHNKIPAWWTTALIISNEEMKDIIRMAEYLEDTGLLTDKRSYSNNGKWNKRRKRQIS